MSKKKIITPKLLHNSLFKALSGNRTTSTMGYKYPKVGIWTSFVRKVEICHRGYHVSDLFNLYNYTYPFDYKIYIVETKGKYDATCSKSCFQQIRLIRQLPFTKKDLKDWKKYTENIDVDLTGYESEKLIATWFVRRVMRNYRRQNAKKNK